jgi:hypothetical protein
LHIAKFHTSPSHFALSLSVWWKLASLALIGPQWSQFGSSNLGPNFNHHYIPPPPGVLSFKGGGGYNPTPSFILFGVQNVNSLTRITVLFPCKCRHHAAIRLSYPDQRFIGPQISNFRKIHSPLGWDQYQVEV